jgi:hypothetical protein
MFDDPAWAKGPAGADEATDHQLLRKHIPLTTVLFILTQ